MDSQFEADYYYTTDTNGQVAVDEAGEVSAMEAEGPDGGFDVTELEILAWKRREWMQARKKEKSMIMQEICREFAKMEKHHNLRLVEWQEREEHTHMKDEVGVQGNTNGIDMYQQALTAFMQEDLTDEQLQAACNIMDKWNGPEGPTPEIQAQNAQKYVVKYMHNFAEEMWRYCGMRMVCLMGWKSDNGTIQACSMDFNSDIEGGSSFNNMHALDASWRDYLGVTYENLDIAGAAEVENILANRPRAKKGDTVELVTNEDGQIWIGDLKACSCNCILQMIRRFLTAHYWQACGRCSAMVLFKKLGQYQADMIAPRHLPENFTFTVDPSHMWMSTAMELLTFWHAQQASHPEDVFAFQKWLDQSGELNSPSDRRALPLNIARNRNWKSWECPISTEETMDDEDGDEETEAEDTHIKSPTHHTCKGLSKAHTCPHKKTQKSASWNDTTENEDREEDAGLKATHSKLPVPHNVRVPSHPQKKTPMPRKPASNPTTDDEEGNGRNCTDDDLPNTPLPVLKRHSKSQGSAMKQKGSHISTELWDPNEYIDDDGFDSVPFVDICTTYPGPSEEHRKVGKLKSALKHAPRAESELDLQAENTRSLKHSSNSNWLHKNTNPLNGNAAQRQQATDNRQGHRSPSAEEACQAPMLPDANAPSPPPRKSQKHKIPRSDGRVTKKGREDGPPEGGWIYLGQIDVNVLKDIVCMGPSTHSIAEEPINSLIAITHVRPTGAESSFLPPSGYCPNLTMSAIEAFLSASSRDLLERMQNAEVPTPPVSLVHVLAKPPAKVPKPDLFERMKNAEVPTPPVSLVHALAKPPSEAPEPDLFKRMKNVEVPTPPSPSKAPKPDLFKRMRNVEVPTLPTALPESQRATIPQVPLPTKGDYVFIYLLYDIANLTTVLGTDSHQSGNVPQNANHRSSPGILSGYRLSFVFHLSEVHVDRGDAPDRSNRVNFGDPDWRQLGALFSYALAGDLPTIEEHQLLQCAELAAADTNDDGSPVKSLQVGQYTVDMLDLLEVLWYPHVGYDVEPYAGGMPRVCNWPKEWFYNLHLDLCQEDQRRFQDELQQIPLTTIWMNDQIGHFIPNWIPRSANKNVSMHGHLSGLQWENVLMSGLMGRSIPTSTP
ncbi:hypothetical protein EDC04DRAFT_2605133 [Pisolithus marmoratus]|nr:hypothetical protein EDC04DRAFT_2605133 [Pisolithus marmoratus]